MIASANPSSTTYAASNATVPEGAYYLEIRGAGTGSPLSDPPSGYTLTHSQGRFWVSGSVIAPASCALTPGQASWTTRPIGCHRQSIAVRSVTP